MKIGNSPSTDGSASTAKAEPRPAARKADTTAATAETARSTAAAPAASTQVAISDAAQIVASTGAASDDGSFDAAKVDRIAKAISEGKFTVNANAIADKLVSNAQELLSARSASSNKH